MLFFEQHHTWHAVLEVEPPEQFLSHFEHAQNTQSHSTEGHRLLAQKVIIGSSPPPR
jgi:hypothetical protein